MKQKETAAMDRRDFFRKAGLGAGALGVAAVGLTATQAKAGATKTPAKGAGYRETAHVKKFYDLARF